MTRELHIFFFFNDTATTEIYTLSLHDALPIFLCGELHLRGRHDRRLLLRDRLRRSSHRRSEEHTSELQSHLNLVCRLLLEKKKFYMLVAHVLAACVIGQKVHDRNTPMMKYVPV